MFSEKNFVITIGNYGAVVALHENNIIKNKIFLEELTDVLQNDLRNLLTRNKSVPVYMVLDTVDQSYRKKSYPFLRKGDLIRIIKRDLVNDSSKDSIKNYIVFGDSMQDAASSSTKITNRRWDCLFVSSSNSELFTKWLGFLLDIPNRLVGIYMLPLETFSMFKLLKNSIIKSSKVKNKQHDLYCMVIHNKVSGIRQIVFSEEGIVFTRVVNYDFQESDFLEKYKQDIHSTFEYLKRLFPDLKISDLDIINIFSEEVLTVLKTIDPIELNVINYTPAQAADECGYSKILPENSNYCDLLISKIFSKGKKILKFTTPKIKFFEKFFLILKTTYYTNLALLSAGALVCLFILFSAAKVDLLVRAAEKEKAAAIEEMNQTKTMALGIDEKQLDSSGGEINIDRVLDLGKINEALGKDEIVLSDIYTKLNFLTNFEASLSEFSYNALDFNPKSPSGSSKYNFNIRGTAPNKGGDIEDLFKRFDSFIAESKKNFEGYDFKYSELPQNINFTDKYYTFPIEFKITKN